MTFSPTTTPDRRWHERRSGAVNALRGVRRRYARIIRKYPSHPVEISIAITMLLNACVLVFFPAIPPLPFPWLFGQVLGVIGLIGLIGHGLGSLPLRALFAFTGIGVRVSMTLFYIQRDWHDPAWTGYFVSATMLAWVLVRVACDAAKSGDLIRWLDWAKGVPFPARGRNE